MQLKFFTVVLMAMFAINASAQNNRGLRDERHRIREGRRSGELTGRETARLNREKASLRREAIRYKHNDGRIGPRERADLARDNRRLNRNIFREKHDRQRRF